MLDSSSAVVDHFLHLCGHAGPPKLGLVIGTEFAADPGVQHLCDIHSWQSLDEPWGLQTKKLLPAHQPVCGNGRGLLGRVSAFSFLKGQPFPLLCSWHLPANASDPVLSTWKSTQSQS